jgi:hypothetical protein
MQFQTVFFDRSSYTRMYEDRIFQEYTDILEVLLLN